MNLWKVVFRRKYSFHVLWEVYTDKPVNTIEDAVSLIQKGIMKNLTPGLINKHYRYIKKGKWRVSVGTPNSIEVSYVEPAYKELKVITITSLRKNFIPAQKKDTL
jgi:hypothetical protein